MQRLIPLTEKVFDFQHLLHHSKIADTSTPNGVLSVEDIKNRIEKYKEEDSERLLRLGIIGRVKAGKSSLLNALLFEGRDVLPKAATPMTAALTCMRYGETFAAKVMFYSEADIKEIQTKAQEYKTLYDKVLAEEIDTLTKAQATSRKKLTPDEIRTRAERKVNRDLKENTNAACFEQAQQMAEAGVSLSSLQKQSEINATSIEDLMKQLNDYVGAKGKYMPFTKEVELYLPEEGLKGLEIVDTPGVNDPIASREERTNEFLKTCDAVLLISPSESFLSEQDVSFLGRITKGSGITRASIIASKADDDLFGSLATQNNPVAVFRTLESQLTEQARKTLTEQRNETIAQDVIELFKKEQIICTSSMAFNLYKHFEKKANWDEGMNTVWNNFQHFYPIFNESDKAKSILEDLSNIQAVKKVIERANEDKDEIIRKNRLAEIPTQLNNLNACLQSLENKLIRQIEVLKKSNKEEIEKQEKTINDQADKIKKVSESCFIETLGELKPHTETVLENVLNKCVADFDQRANSKIEEKSREERYTTTERREKSGVFGWLGRKTGWGGYEDVEVTKYRTVYYKIVNTNNILEDIKSIRNNIQSNLNTAISAIQEIWKETLTEEIIQALRIEFEPHLRPNEDLVEEALKKAFENMKTDVFNLNSIPDELNRNSQLEGNAAQEYVAKAQDYMRKLRSDVRVSIVNYLRNEFARLSKFPISDDLMKHLNIERDKLAQLVKDKDLYLKEYNKLLTQAKTLQAEVSQFKVENNA